MPTTTKAKPLRTCITPCKSSIIPLKTRKATCHKLTCTGKDSFLCLGSYHCSSHYSGYKKFQPQSSCLEA